MGRWLDNLFRASGRAVPEESLRILCLNHHQTLGVLSALCITIGAVLVGWRLMGSPAHASAQATLVDAAIIAFVVSSFTCFVGEMLYSEVASWCPPEGAGSYKANSLFNIPSGVYYLGVLWLSAGVRILLRGLPLTAPAKWMPLAQLVVVAIIGAAWVALTSRDSGDQVYRRAFGGAAIVAVAVIAGLAFLAPVGWFCRPGSPQYLGGVAVATVLWMGIASLLYIRGSLWSDKEGWSPRAVLAIDSAVLTLAAALVAGSAAL